MFSYNFGRRIKPRWICHYRPNNNLFLCGHAVRFFAISRENIHCIAVYASFPANKGLRIKNILLQKPKTNIPSNVPSFFVAFRRFQWTAPDKLSRDFKHISDRICIPLCGKYAFFT